MVKRKKAVALSYQHEKDIAPKVVAKGAGVTAEKILEIAQNENIPTCNNPNLVEKLMVLDLGQAIPEELYQVVAEILIFVDGLANSNS